MSLLLHYNFNENDNTVVYDYSTNGKDATAINNFSVVAGELGFAGRFNGVTTDLIFGDVGGVAGTDKLAVFSKFKKSSDKVQYLAYKRDHFRMYLNGSGKLIFEVFIGGAWFGPTSDLIFNDAEWYNVLCVYDGAKIYIYVAGLEDSSIIKVGNIDASSNDFIIGSDTANFFDGVIELVEVWNTAHTAAQALAHANNPIGIKYKTLQDHNLELGDLISTSVYDSPKGMVVTYKDDSTTYRAVPVLGKINFSETPVRRGNIYQISRQWIAEFVIESDEPIIQFFDGVTSFSLPTSKVKIAKDAVEIAVNTKIGNASNYTEISPSGDVDFVGGAGLCFGGISVVDNVTQTVISSSGTAVQVTIFDTNAPFNNTEPDHTNNHITITKAGTYFITVSATVNSIAGASSRVEMTVMTNNGAGLLDALHVDRNLAGGGGSSGSVSMSGIAALAVNDTVEVWIENETNTQNYTVEDITLTLFQIGG